MSNTVEFKINGLTTALTNQYVQIVDPSTTPRTILHEGNDLTTDSEGNATIDIGSAGTDGQNVLVQCDSYPYLGVDFKYTLGMASVVGADVQWQPITGITEVWVYGASISNSIVDNYQTIMAQRLNDLGYSGVTFVDKSTPSRGIALTLTEWEAEKATITGRNDILVLTHPIGNDVSANRPWATLEQSERDSLIDDYSALINSIVANGNKVIPCGTSFRDYDNDTVNNEELGSKPFDENIVIPALSLIPDDMTNGDGSEYLSLYNFSRNSYKFILAGLVDIVHFNEMGYQLARNLWVDSLFSRLTGGNPIEIERVEDPTTATAIPREFITLYNQSSSSTRGSTLLFGGNDISEATDYYVAPLNGYLPNSIYITNTITSKGNNGTGFDTGDTSQTLTNDAVKKNYISTTSTDWVVLHAMKGFNANQPVTVQVASFKDTGSARNGDFSVDGGATFATVNAANTSTDHYHTFSTTADGNGEIELLGRVSSGASLLYFNGAHVTPNENT